MRGSHHGSDWSGRHLTILFFFKKLVSRVFFPIPLTAEFLIAGLLLIRFSQWRRTGKTLLVTGVGLLFLFGYPALPDFVLHRLEYRYPPLLHPERLEPRPKWVAVLGTEVADDPALPANSQASDTFLVRVLEGVRLYRACDGPKMILSVPGPAELDEKRMFLEELAGIVGVPPADFVLIESARDTADEVREIRGIVGTDRFALVTSASHIPRAVGMFRKQGLDPVPAPCGYLIKHGTYRFSPTYLFPGTSGIEHSERVMYECLGLLWAIVRGQI